MNFLALVLLKMSCWLDKTSLVVYLPDLTTFLWLSYFFWTTDWCRRTEGLTWKTPTGAFGLPNEAVVACGLLHVNYELRVFLFFIQTRREIQEDHKVIYGKLWLQWTKFLIFSAHTKHWMIILKLTSSLRKCSELHVNCWLSAFCNHTEEHLASGIASD